MRCPFCHSHSFKDSWLQIRFDNRVFSYKECRSCRSLICDPMPGEATLLKMYGTSYFDEDAQAERFEWIKDHLNGGRGVFLDYGCGSGELLSIVAEHGYKPVGIEFSPETIAELRHKLPFQILSPTSLSEPADVLHLGDVIEHLTDIENQLPQILSRLKSGGILIASNPLEGNPNLFASAMKLSRRFRGAFDGVPYHVTLATTKGQKLLFERMGLKQLVFKVDEVSFPAPYTLAEAKGLRSLSLYALRKTSQGLSHLTGIQRSGNRYRYIGQKL